MNKAETKQRRIIEFIRSNKTTESERLKMLQTYADEYAQQVSREVAVEFELRHVYKGASKSAKRLAYMQFDEWKSNQEEQ